MALFMTPEQVAAAENASRVGVGSQYEDAVSGNLFNLGNSLGNAFTRGLGGDTRSQAIKDAQFITSTVAKADFNQPETIMAVANELNRAGFTEQAFKFLSALPPERQPQKHIVSNFTAEEQVGNTRKRFLMQLDNLGFVHKVGEISDTAQMAKFGIDSDVMRDVVFTESQTNNYAKRLASLDRFKGLVDEDDETAFVDLTGEVERSAAALKQAHRDMLIEKMYAGEIDDNQVNNAMKGDAWYAEKAYKLWSEGGGLDESTKLGFGINGADIIIRGDINTADIESLQNNQALTLQKNAARDMAAEKQGQFYAGDERTNQFRLSAVNDLDGRELFQNMPASNEEFEAQLTERGFTFDDKVRDWHYDNWDIIRENPGAARIWFAGAGDADLRDAEVSRYLDQLLDQNDIAGWAYAQAMYKYLARMPVGRNPSRATGRFPGKQ